MPEVVDWLKTLGMSEYAERFAESDIDTSVLCELTDQDLEELGVSLGHRRKMLRRLRSLSLSLRHSSACVDRAKAQRHCRASSSHGDVLGPRRFNSTLGAYGP